MADLPIHPQLSGHDDTDWHLHLAPRHTPVWQELTAAAVFGLAVQVQELGIDRLGMCSEETCADVYVDSSANQSRRYCSPSCSNRANVKAWRARRRSEGSPAS
jgi:predicted RNA-binding Zn ribbon-like protein